MKFKPKNKCCHEFQYTKHATPPTVCIDNFTVFSLELLHGSQQWITGTAVRACICSGSPWAGSAGRKPSGAQWGHRAPTLLSRQSDVKNVICNLSTCFFLDTQYISTYHFKIWVRLFMGFRVLLGNILFNSFSFFVSIFKLLHVK